MPNVEQAAPNARLWPLVHTLPPGGSLLGGAAAGLSYEGALRDALARDERTLPRPTRRTLPKE